MSEENTARPKGGPTWEQQWAALSPFARAAACVSLAERASAMASEMTAFGEWAGSGGLDRRVRHCAGVADAARLLAGALGGLCAEADAECAVLLGEPKGVR